MKFESLSSIENYLIKNNWELEYEKSDGSHTTYLKDGLRIRILYDCTFHDSHGYPNGIRIYYLSEDYNRFIGPIPHQEIDFDTLLNIIFQPFETDMDDLIKKYEK